MVTVNTASLRPPPGGSKPGAVTLPTTIKALQPRVVTSVGGQAKSALTPGSISSSKPSVIVVQRSSGIGGGGATVVPAKALLTKVRILDLTCLVNGQGSIKGQGYNLIKN